MKSIPVALEEGKSASDLNVPGNRPYKKAGAGPVPSAGKGCSPCGLCASICPHGAIQANSPKQSDKDKCISCMKCIASCPNEARSINPVMYTLVKTMLKNPCRERKEIELFY